MADMLSANVRALNRFYQKEESSFVSGPPPNAICDGQYQQLLIDAVKASFHFLAVSRLMREASLEHGSKDTITTMKGISHCQFHPPANLEFSLLKRT